MLFLKEVLQELFKVALLCVEESLVVALVVKVDCVASRLPSVDCVDFGVQLDYLVGLSLTAFFILFDLVVKTGLAFF